MTLFDLSGRTALVTGAGGDIGAAISTTREGAGAQVLRSDRPGLRGNSWIGTNALTKAALAQHARSLAVEWGPRGVRPNPVAPGLTATRFAATVMADATFMARRIAPPPPRRPGTVDGVAGTVLWLCSPAGDFVTAQTIVVDGGTLMSDGS